MIFTYYRDADGDADTNIGTFSTALERADRDDTESTRLQALRNAPVTTIHGIGTARAERFETAGYDTVHDVATADPIAIETDAGIAVDTARPIVESARSILR